MSDFEGPFRVLGCLATVGFWTIIVLMVGGVAGFIALIGWLISLAF